MENDQTLQALLSNSSDEDEVEESSEEEFTGDTSTLDDSNDSSSSEDLDNFQIQLPQSSTEIFKAKDGTIWKVINDHSSVASRLSMANIVRTQRGPSPYARRTATSPLAALRLLISQSIISLITKYTRIEAQRVFPNTNCTLNGNEIWKFIALMYARGVLAAKNIPLNELWDQNKGNPIFRNTMSRDRFKYILRLLRFDDKEDRRQRILMQKDKLAHISEIWNTFVENCRKYYNPVINLCVDEQLFPTKARCPFTQYISSKPDKFGIKFWLLADVQSKYLLNAAVYTGTDETRPPNVRIGDHIVWKLTEPFHKGGYNITCDNFFTSISLAKTLLQVDTIIVGTTRANRKEIPDIARKFTASKEYPVFSSMFFKDVNSPVALTTYKYKKSKSVYVLSSMHSQNIVCDKTPKRKPETITYYNNTKFGVDILDAMARLYSVKPGCRRWPVHVFCNILDMAAINAWIIYKESNHPNQKRRNFLFSLIDELINDDENLRIPTSVSSSFTEPTRKTCQIRKACKSNKATNTCINCKKNTCGSCTKEKILQIICKNCK